MKKTSERNTALSLWLKNHYTFIWWLIFFLSAIPFILLIYRYNTEQLGINPLETLTRATGKWALIFLIITLLITPLRRFMSWLSRRLHAAYGKRIADWNWIVRLRRMLGLYCFFYALLHLLIFLHFDLTWDWEFLWEDIQEKQYILLGFAAFILLTLLAVTSFNRMLRWLGKKWKTIHQSIYLISILVLIHFWMLVKVGVYTPLPYTLLIGALLLYRTAAYLGLFFNNKDRGEIVAER